MRPASGPIPRPYSPTSLDLLGLLAALAGYSMCLVISLDPAGNSFGVEDYPLLKYLPNALMIFSFMMMLPAAKTDVAFRTRAFWAGAIFCLLQIGGAVIWIRHDQATVENSFLGRGISVLALFAGALIGSRKAYVNFFGPKLVPVMIATSLTCLAILLARATNLAFLKYSQVLHVESVFAAAGVMWLCNRFPFFSLRLASIVAFTLIGARTGKSTDFLLALALVATTFGKDFLRVIRRVWRGANRDTRGIVLIIAVVTIAVIAAIILFVAYLVVLERSERYQNDPRRVAYALRWDQFLTSPLIGQLFVGSPAIPVPHHSEIFVPSHNDILDILALSGAFGMALYLLVLIPAIFNRVGAGAIGTVGRQIKSIHYFWYFMICYLVVTSGNPMFSTPYFAVPIWFSMGLLAIVRSRDKAADKTLARPPRRAPYRRANQRLAPPPRFVRQTDGSNQW